MIKFPIGLVFLSGILIAMPAAPQSIQTEDSIISDGSITTKQLFRMSDTDYSIALIPSASPAGGGVFDLRIVNFDTGAIAFSTGTNPSSASIRMRVFNTGDVGIGLGFTATPSYKLHVNGSVGATSYSQISSREAKTAIRPLIASTSNEILHRLLAMELTTYEYKDEYGGDGRRHLGLIAEDLPAELRSGDGQSVDLYALLTYTIGALQAQQRQIEYLSERRDLIDRLAVENSHLDAELKTLRSPVKVGRAYTAARPAY